MSPINRRTFLASSGGIVLAACSSDRFTNPAAGSGLAGSSRTSRIIAPAERTVLPVLAGKTLTGNSLDTKVWRGAPIVVNFWGSWCVPCRDEAADLRRTALATQPLGVHFLGIDVRDDPAAGLAFEERYKIPYESLFDEDGQYELAFGSAAPRAVPTTHILDAQGRVAVQFIGRVTYAQLQPTVLHVLSETNPDLRPISPSPSIH